MCDVQNGVCFWTCSLILGHMNSETSDVLTSNASLSALASSSLTPLPACWWWLLAISELHPSSTLSSCSPHSLIDWSVVFVFNASLSALAPSSPMTLSACWCLLLAFSAIFPSSTFSCSRDRSSVWTAVSVFNSSHSSPMTLTACCFPSRSPSFRTKAHCVQVLTFQM